MKKSNFIPLLLGAYTVAMAAIGYPHLASGYFRASTYFGLIVASVIVIFALRSSLKSRERTMRTASVTDIVPNRINKA